MFNALSLLLVTTGLSVVMLFVLTSLAGSGIAGVREWRQANGLAVLALLLAATRGIVPDFLSIEVGNAMLLVAISLMLAGFRRHLGLAVPVRAMVVGGALALAALVTFHYGVDSVPLRTVSMSIYHGAVCFTIGWSISLGVDARLRYSHVFTKVVAFALAFGHLVRGTAYALQAEVPLNFLDPSTQNLVFFALGTLALPGLTLGAVMMANARVIAETAYAADHDYLTGAPSRRAFFALAEREHARAARRGGALALLLVDVDHFKRINDTHGHGVGDQVLRDLVRQAQEVIRKIDYCARLGGEEFAVLLPDADRDTALAVAERLRGALDRSLQLASPPIRVPYTVSIGAALLEPGETFAGLMTRADTALYAAKTAGRNRVMCAQAPAPLARAQDAVGEA
ncbi:GGDEF domain-containing protein [Massilia sp.]|uniref:GGDEF domain-containing protein n=1 Tax=Massilia sp. TaxID=1882437 RepID=UPI0028AD37E9|nr:GGDEF domain-containing protein [Massilia sp.]